MPNTYSQVYIHLVMVIKYRKAQIDGIWENELYKYITGIVQSKGHKMIAINGMPDHIHIFIGMRTDCALSSLVREIKKSTNHFINQKKFTKEKFYWQAGYGAFSYSNSHISKVANYIERQKIHHEKKALKEEYLQLLEKFEIEYKPQHLPEWV